MIPRDGILVGNKNKVWIHTIMWKISFKNSTKAVKYKHCPLCDSACMPLPEKENPDRKQASVKTRLQVGMIGLFRVTKCDKMTRASLVASKSHLSQG